MTSNITYISAFYHIPENKKHNLEHYQKHIQYTFYFLNYHSTSPSSHTSFS